MGWPGYSRSQPGPSWLGACDSADFRYEGWGFRERSEENRLTQAVQGSQKNEKRSPRKEMLRALNEGQPPGARVEFEAEIPLGPTMSVQKYRLGNGLTIMLSIDASAPVASYHTWFAVGSRHEKVGKTGLAHLFEHLMFNETEKHAAGKDAKVALVAINSNTGADESLAKMTDRATKKKYAFPYLADPDGKTAKAYGAMYTPEFFVLDKDRKVFYLGAMDDKNDAATAK